MMCEGKKTSLVVLVLLGTYAIGAAGAPDTHKEGISLVQKKATKVTALASKDDCNVAEWGKWGDCTKTCASKKDEEPGKMIRFRHVEPKLCAKDFEEKECPNARCPIDCQMAEWTEWGECMGECKNEGSMMNRTRKVLQKPAHGGKCCPETPECEEKAEPACGPALTVEHKPCGGEKQKCVPSMWSEWSPCSKTCNTGKSSRARGIKTPAKCGGAPCLCNFLEIKNCEVASCRQECELSEWSEWSKCPVTCGGSAQTRHRKVLKAPSGGGADCPPLVESKNCGTKCCKRDCVLASWSEWSFCSASCYGTQQRTRKVDVTSCGDGKKCDSLFESKQCNHDCVLPCEVGEWGKWSQCSASCGGGSKTRHRKITQLEANGGPNCPPLWETACCEESNAACPDGEKSNSNGDELPKGHEGETKEEHAEDDNDSNHNNNANEVPKEVKGAFSNNNNNNKNNNNANEVPKEDVSIENGGSIDITIQGSKTSTHHKNKTSSHSEHHINKTSSHSKSENATHKKETKTSKTETISKHTEHSVEITHTVTVSSQTQLKQLVQSISNDMHISKSITVEGTVLHKGEELIDILHKNLLKDAKLPVKLHFVRTEGGKEIKGDSSKTVTIVSLQKTVTLESQKLLTELVESLSNSADMKLTKSITIDGWILESGDELLQQGTAESVVSTQDLLELKLPAKLTFQRSGTSVTPWKKAPPNKQTTVVEEKWEEVSEEVVEEVVVSRVITITGKSALQALGDSLDENWVVVKEVHHDGLALDVGDELLAEGAMAKAKVLDDLFETELPAKLVFLQRSQLSGDEETIVEENGHTVTTKKVTTHSTKTTSKTIKGHVNNNYYYNNNDFPEELKKHLKSNNNIPEELMKHLKKQNGNVPNKEEYYYNDEIPQEVKDAFKQ